MNNPLRFIVGIALVLSINMITQAKEWRGIVPLHSSRVDIEKLLGPPRPPPKDWHYILNPGRSIYFLDEGVVQVFFADHAYPDGEDCLRSVAAGTVLSIVVVPKPNLKLKDIGINLTGVQKFNPSLGKDPEYAGYYGKKAGFIVTTYKGNVSAICYLAAAEDRHFCRSYYRNAKALVETRVEW
jgi:hypothetical protein